VTDGRKGIGGRRTGRGGGGWPGAIAVTHAPRSLSIQKDSPIVFFKNPNPKNRTQLSYDEEVLFFSFKTVGKSVTPH
jgi:hypothetical protein